MADPRMQKLADILVNYSTKVKPGDWVMVWPNTVALPLAREVYRCVLWAGGHPALRLDDDDLNEVFMAEASDEQLQWVSPVTSVSVSQVNVMIRLNAAHNTRVLMGVDPAKSRTRQVARREIMEIYHKRAATKDLRWVTTQYPCHAHAQEADMSLHEYEDFIYHATFADQPDPVERWQAVHDRQQHWVDWLKGKREVRVQGPNVDLTLSIAERSFINSDGENNMPSGEIYTSPVEDSAAGWIRFTYPAVRLGRAVEDVSLEFKAGKVVAARAEKNAEYLNTMLDSDEVPASSVSLPSAQTTPSSASPRTCCSMRKSAGPSTLPWAAVFQKPVGSTSRPSTGIWYVICAQTARSTSTASSSIKMVSSRSR